LTTKKMTTATPPQAQNLKVDDIIPNPNQPRKVFDEQELQDLQESVQAKGMLQPIIVRPPTVGEKHYQLIDGERRWRVSKRLGWQEIRAIVDESVKTSRDAAIKSLIMNSQRADLPPLEKENAIRELFEELDKSVKELSKTTGYSEQTVKEYLKAQEFRAKLPSAIQRGTTKTALAETEFIKEEGLRIKVLELIHDDRLPTDSSEIRFVVKLLQLAKEGRVPKAVPEAYLSGLLSRYEVEKELEHKVVPLFIPIVSDRIPKGLKEATIFVWDYAWKASYLRSEEHKRSLEESIRNPIAFRLDDLKAVDDGVLDRAQVKPIDFANLSEEEQKEVRDFTEMQVNVDREDAEDFVKYYDEQKKLIESPEMIQAKYGEQVRRHFSWWISSTALEKTNHLQFRPDLRIPVLDVYADHVYLEEVKRSIKEEEEKENDDE
jgi:ParB/RepB/Spo0J family partition protein